MKTFIVIITFLTLTVSVTAQGQNSYTYIVISKTQFDNCRKPSYLIKNSLITKKAGRLIIPIAGKAAKNFKDNNTEEGFHKFEYVGNIKGTQLLLIKKTDYNHEEFYFINHLKGVTDTLIGIPVFSLNMLHFSCINIPGTDEKQYIQTGIIKSGNVVLTNKLEIKKDLHFTEVKCATANAVLTKNSEGQFWKITFQMQTKSGTKHLEQ
jgi:hypothetical protein